MQLYDCSFEDTLLQALSDPITVQFHKQGDDDGMVIFIFERILQLDWYNEFSNVVSPQTTFMKIAETGNDTIDISFIDSVMDYHITIPGLAYNKLQFNRFKENMPTNKPLLLLAGILDVETQKPVVLTISNNKKQPIFITMGGYLDLS